ncbi:hypothetical protein L282_1182 [Escherichia coli APEC IMT5155]|nr:hypothetical protein L282_1182 [Escherichia coli APEC IMT5155]EGW65396.1 hypothetical protein ECSTECC16502_3712 [Escherichia coli STEC_C165-02]KDX31630.1 hypothetical protein AB41_1609 [Escherichia coli 1-250-04_S1_C2]KDX33358.1 hypothetical protein AB13_1419 [Escherichia coli 1-250-04_S1_C1]
MEKRRHIVVFEENMPVYKEEKCCIKNLFIVGSSCFWAY